MRSRSEIKILDPLYGDLVLRGPIAELSCTPCVQRLREIRLSNIDSLCMPGIANISRYEHSIGTAHLANSIGFSNHLTETQFLILQAAAMLHDFAITAFGHLVEEALQYALTSYDHERKFATLVQNPAEGELGGINLQMYVGRESGIRGWAEQTFGAEAEKRINEIVEMMNGKGDFGPTINGTIDLDNLDNLTRIAFHMGLEIDKSLPSHIARGIIGSSERIGITISVQAVRLIEKWLQLRKKVYNRLMLSRDDFAGKAMLIYSIVAALKRGDLENPDYVWTLTDRMLLEHLLHSNEDRIAKTVQSWLVRDLWPVSDLIWMHGKAPEYSALTGFNEFLSDTLQRPCFAYRISDKRTRALNLHLQSDEAIQLGVVPSSWVLGVVSPKRKDFTSPVNKRIQAAASEFFNTKCLGKAGDPTVDTMPLLDCP